MNFKLYLKSSNFLLNTQQREKEILLTGFISEHTGISANDEIDESGNVQKSKLVISCADMLYMWFNYLVVIFNLVVW